MTAQRNRFKVQKRKWSSWSQVARRVFNETFAVMTQAHDVLAPAALKGLPKRSLRVYAWNVSWCAADSADGR